MSWKCCIRRHEESIKRRLNSHNFLTFGRGRGYSIDAMALVSLPEQPISTPYPRTSWPKGDINSIPSIDHQRLNVAIEGFWNCTEINNRAFVLIHKGRLCYERYAQEEDVTPLTTLGRGCLDDIHDM